jgi:hypothetical protein
MNTKAHKVMCEMIESGLISKDGPIIISEQLLNEYSKIYNKLFGKKNNTFTKGEVKFFKRMAALNLTKLNDYRTKTKILTSSRNLQRSGFLYLISNSVYPGYYKVGITKDVEKRLSAYQTYDPLKRFKIEHYTFCDDVREEERRIINKFSINIKNGEWVKSDDALSILREVRSML